MVDFPGNVEWVNDLVPDLAARIAPFEVDTDEMDEELVGIFIEEIRRLSADLQDGVSRNDNSLVRMAAHSIKGMGGTMGLPEISVLALEIENRAKAERLADTKPLVDALANWLATFQ